MPAARPHDLPAHPATQLAADDVAVLRRAAAAAERRRRLAPAQLDLIHARGWLRLALPPALRGPGLTLPGVLRLEESLAWADGSTGWVVTLCGGAAWFTGFLDPQLSAALFAEERACIAGSGAVGGIAEQTADGWRLDGRWRYASGITHATAVTANCRVQRAGVPLEDATGAPLVRAFLLTRGEYRIEPDWHAMGMAATGSHAFAVAGVTVPARRCFAIEPAAAVRDEPLYRVPFRQFAESTLAANLSGLVVRFLDLCGERAAAGAGRDGAALVARRARRFATRRAQLYRAAGTLWQACAAGRAPAPHELNETSAASLAMAQAGRAVLGELHPLCGLGATDTRSEINRVWRDFHTASQHALLAPRPATAP